MQEERKRCCIYCTKFCVSKYPQKSREWVKMHQL